MTLDTLKRAMPNVTAARWSIYGESLLAAMEVAEITTPQRAAHFLAQIGHESLDLSRMEESLNYSADRLVAVWPARFTAETAALYARQPEKIANFVYANRMGNGDEASGDGWRFRGRGSIGITGRVAYAEFGRSVNRDLLADPGAVAEEPALAIGAATWHWTNRQINQIADRDDLPGATGCSLQSRRLASTINGKRPFL